MSHIGNVLEEHLIKLGALHKDTSRQEAALQMLKEKELNKLTEESKQQPACPECIENSMILLDGCLTCTQCGYSKCG